MAWRALNRSDFGKLGDLLLQADELKAERNGRPTSSRCEWCGKPVVMRPTGQVRRFCDNEQRCYRRAESAAFQLNAAAMKHDPKADATAKLLIADTWWARAGRVPPAVYAMLRLDLEAAEAAE